MSVATELQRIIDAKADLKTAIENKGVAVSSSALLDAYPTLIDSISTGGAVEEKEVNFYDYDGTLLHGYTIAEAQALEALPDNPDRTDEGLVAQGWNWTLAEVNALTHRANIGQVYDTSDTKTHIKIVLDNSKHLTVYSYIVNATIDWGDGTTTSPTSSSSHTYSAVGEYEIVVEPINRSDFKYNSANYGAKPMLHICNLSANHYNTSIVKEVHVGSGALCTDGSVPNCLKSYSFTHLAGMKKLSLPSNLAKVNDIAMYADSLKCIVIPRTTTLYSASTIAMYSRGIEHICFPNSSNGTTGLYGTVAYCSSLKELIIPDGFVYSDNPIASECNALKYVYLPSSFTTVKTYEFNKCYSLVTIDVPNVTVIKNTMFGENYSLQNLNMTNCTTIEYGAFNTCEALQEITFPASLTSIAGSPFVNTKSLSYITVLATTPPTLGGSGYFPTGTLQKIYVPAGTLATYQAATNWSNYASYMEELSE